MTVQELIDALMKIEDKSMIVIMDDYAEVTRKEVFAVTADAELLDYCDPKTYRGTLVYPEMTTAPQV